MKAIQYGLVLVLCLGFLCGCAPVRDAAGKVSGGLGEVSDELGKERKIGAGDEALVIEPIADKKVRMNF